MASNRQSLNVNSVKQMHKISQRYKETVTGIFYLISKSFKISLDEKE